MHSFHQKTCPATFTRKFHRFRQEICSGCSVSCLLTGSVPMAHMHFERQFLVGLQSVLDPAKKAYADKTGKKAPSIAVDSNTFLPPAPKSGSHDPACSGGVVIASKDGKIVCNNTLDARLEICFNQNQPAIRKAMFGGHVRA